MKTLMIFILFLLSLNLFAIEVGDIIPECIKVKVRSVEGVDSKECIESYKGKKFLLIEFMSIYCGSCVRAMPDVNKIGNVFIDKVSTRFVSIDRDLKEVKNFWHEYRKEISHPYLFDYKRLSRKPYRFKYTPTTILVDQNRKVLYKHVGEFEDDSLELLVSFLEK